MNRVRENVLLIHSIYVNIYAPEICSKFNKIQYIRGKLNKNMTEKYLTL